MFRISSLLFVCFLVLTVGAGANPKASPASQQRRNGMQKHQFPMLHKVPRVRQNSGDYVVLVHGLSWMRDTMKALGKHLNAQGYHTIEVHYPSRSIAIDEVLNSYVRPAVVEHCTDPKKKVHFVGHSMGCVMIRKLLTESKINRLGNVVMLAAPNQGIELADFFMRSPVIRKVFGESVYQIGADPDSEPNNLGPVTFSPGIIMGSKSAFPVVSDFIPEKTMGWCAWSPAK